MQGARWDVTAPATLLETGILKTREGPSVCAGGPPRAPTQRLVPAPTASEAPARDDAENEDDDCRAKNRREDRDTTQRQIRGDDDVQDVDHQPGAHQAGDDRTEQPTGHTSAYQSFANQSRDGADQQQDEQVRKRNIKPPSI